MDIYVFSSNTLTNIWAGIGAKKWAVSKDQADNAGTRTKARALRIGSLGILYSTPSKTFTSPFMVASVPDQAASVAHIWPEVWWLPFSIHPLGSPDRQMSTSDISKLPVVKASGRSWNNVFFTQGNFAFQPSRITEEDWAILFRELVA
jgi:hypothetical protein